LDRPVVQLAASEREIAIDIPPGYPFTEAVPEERHVEAPTLLGPFVEVPLSRLAFARSGDKGDSANIAIIARKPQFVAVLRNEVTPERMAAHFRHLVEGPVERFEAPGLHAFNFLLRNALGGGGMASLRIDPQGKAYAAMALEMGVAVPVGLLGG
jgi:hypothetical protein